MIKKLASIQLFFVLAICLILAMTVGTLIPQNQSPEKYHQMFSHLTLQILQTLGFLDIYHTNWFIGLLSLLGLNTFACIYMRISERKFKKMPWGALISHTAILVILLGGIVSVAFGKKGVLPLRVGDAACCVPSASENGKTIHIPFQVRLADFQVEYYSSGQHYIQLAHTKEGWNETIEVQPSKNYIIKDKIHLNVLRHLPDFRVEKDSKSGKWVPYSVSAYPNNPALEVELTASPTKKMWLFAKHPEFSNFFHGNTNHSNVPLDIQYQFVPGKIKQFKSRVEILPADKSDSKPLLTSELSVNSPFKYGGYTFYQSGYDPENSGFSSFQVAKDPGVPLVYAGFILLPLGLTISFYGRNREKI